MADVQMTKTNTQADAPASSPLPSGGIEFITSDDKKVIASKNAMCNMSSTCRNLIEDLPNITEIPLPTMSEAVLAKIVSYCEYHDKHPEFNMTEKYYDGMKEIPCEFDRDWIPHVADFFDEANLVEIRSMIAEKLRLIKGADFLHVKQLREMLAFSLARDLIMMEEKFGKPDDSNRDKYDAWLKNLDV